MSGRDPQSLIQWEEAGRWLAKANEDIRMAALGLTADPPLVAPAAYHCQQAAEKIIKGLLVSVAVRIPRTHDLEALAALASPLYPEFAPQIDGFIPITEWATTTRYPDYGGGLGADIDDITDAVSRLTTFLHAVIARGPNATPASKTAPPA